MTTSNHLIVCGRYGTLSVEARTGKVINYQPDSPDEPEYSDIARIDLSAYEAEYKYQLNPGDHVSIMDLNFWLHDDSYIHKDHHLILSDVGKCEWAQPVFVFNA